MNQAATQRAEFKYSPHGHSSSKNSLPLLLDSGASITPCHKRKSLGCKWNNTDKPFVERLKLVVIVNNQHMFVVEHVGHMSWQLSHSILWLSFGT